MQLCWRAQVQFFIIISALNFTLAKLPVLNSREKAAVAKVSVKQA